MKVILLKDVPKIGKKYDVKNVADGHAVNFLIPHKLAQMATEDALSKVETMRAQETVGRKVHEDLILKNLDALSEARVEFSAAANEKGHLFKGIHKEEISEELKKQAHVELPADYIVLEHPLKEVGEHTIAASVGNKKTSFTVSVSAL